jgi:hypothetical protein
MGITGSVAVRACGASSNCDLVLLRLHDHPQDHLLHVGWIVPIWVLDLDHHMHDHVLPNQIWKSDLKTYLSGRIHHLCDLLQEEAKKFLHVVPEMHARDFLQTTSDFLPL